METITFNFKTKLEQFKEQFPSLYAEIYQLGYMDATNTLMRSSEDDSYDDANLFFYDNYGDDNPYDHCYNCGCADLNCDCYYAIPTDDSERYSIAAKWQVIYDRAKILEQNGYKAENKDWKQFMNSYKDWSHNMYIAWNPTHKQFVVESSYGVIEELYPNLCKSTSLYEDSNGVWSLEKAL